MTTFLLIVALVLAILSCFGSSPKVPFVPLALVCLALVVLFDHGLIA